MDVLWLFKRRGEKSRMRSRYADDMAVEDFERVLQAEGALTDEQRYARLAELMKLDDKPAKTDRT